MKNLMIALSAAAVLASAAVAQTQGQTHPPHDASKATAVEVDCDAMEKKMGMNQQHSHAEEKGTVAHSAMNHEHMRCKAEKDKKAARAK